MSAGEVDQRMAGRWSGPNDSDCERPLVTDLWLLGWPTPRVITGPKRAFVRTAGAVPPHCRGSFHRVLHRTYSHSYPQAVRDFSQPEQPVRRSAAEKAALLHCCAGGLRYSPQSETLRLGVWRQRDWHSKIGEFREKLTLNGGFRKHRRV